MLAPGLGRRAGVIIGLLALAGCATNETSSQWSPPNPPSPAARAPPPTSEPAAPLAVGQLPMASLPGWSQEDHASALRAFEQSCAAVRLADLEGVCRRARQAGVLGESQAREFLETNFRADPLTGRGLLTAYFAPQYQARTHREGAFTAPVRPRPADLIVLDLGAFDPTLAGRKLSAQLVDGQLIPYPDRAAIEAQTPDQVLAWMKPEDLFF